jgi:hypothetical protein
MAQRSNNQAVRPLAELRPQRGAPRLPGLVTIGLLVAGGMAGYLFGLPGDTAGAGAAITTTTGEPAPISSATPLPYQWLEQVPQESEQDAWAVHVAEELDGAIYLLVSDDPDSPLSRALWRSQDGQRWELLPLDFDARARVTDLDIYQQSLLLSGWVGSTPAIWRSQRIGTSGSPGWTATALSSGLDAVGRPVTEFSTVTTVVNSAGRTVTVAESQISLEDELLSLSDDPAIASLLHFEELPEVTVSSTRVWMRAVAPGGEELVRTSRIPNTVRVLPAAGHYGTDVPALQAWAMWESTDALGFSAVSIPAGLTNPLRPMPLSDGFVATTIDAPGDTELWAATEHGWEPSSWNSPAGCGGWGRTATDGKRLLTITDNFDTVCTSEDGAIWAIRTSPSTALSSQAAVWIEGTNGGFIATARNSLEYAVLTSRDGLEWQRVNATPDILGTRTFLVGDRLVTRARPDGSMTPRPMVVWVGEDPDS